LAATRISRSSALHASIPVYIYPCACTRMRRSCLRGRPPEIMAGVHSSYIMSCDYIDTEIVVHFHSACVCTAAVSTHSTVRQTHQHHEQYTWAWINRLPDV
jgi:hypothetical protein